MKAQQYQGYPYVNPPVVVAPTIDATFAAEHTARLANLPRRPIGRNQNVVINIPHQGDRRDNEISNSTTPSSSGHTTRQESVEAGGSGLRESSQTQHQTQGTSKEDDDAPVVYIDLPSDLCGGNAAHAREEVEEEEPEFIQNTIFYDPFDDRRIDAPKVNQSLRSNSSDADTVSNPSSTIRRPAPERPTTLDLNRVLRPAPTTPGSSTASTTSTPMSRFPEGYLQNRPTPEATLPSPLPGTFREPPPAYTEIDISPVPRQEVPRFQEPVPPPRTQVITTTPITGDIANSDRKFLDCQHCGMRVHTLVVKEIGCITHVLALICIFVCMLPFVCCIYSYDGLKNRNHYCPNCNKVIGYQLPFNKKKIFYDS